MQQNEMARAKTEIARETVKHRRLLPLLYVSLLLAV